MTMVLCSRIPVWTFVTLAAVIVLLITNLSTMTSARQSSRYFSLQPTPRRGPVRLGNPWIDRSWKSCGKTCMTKYNNCTSFLFNSHSGLCTPGAYINEKQPLPSSAEGDFFQSFYCDASKGFSVLSYLKTTACLALFGPKTYMEADADCQSKGAYLISVKTLEKYKLMLFNLTGVRNSWIGCDDKESEGRFIWKEDGQVLTKEEYGLFAPGEPNNYQGAEDCVTILTSAVGLFDYNCSYSQYYVCEMPYKV